jgi:hypothetical protein
MVATSDHPDTFWREDVSYFSAIRNLGLAVYHVATVPGLHPAERSAMLSVLLSPIGDAARTEEIRLLGLRYRNAVLDNHDLPPHPVDHAELDAAIERAATDALNIIADVVSAFRAGDAQ